MTSWGGRGWQLSSGLCRVDWEGAVHVHNPCGRGRGLSSADYADYADYDYAKTLSWHFPFGACR